MKCSVIVPTYNRLFYLKHTLESLLKQDYPETEIIVVNDGSTDGTSDYLDNLIKTISISVIHQENQGPAKARNAGIGKATGEIIAFTDDDCVVPSDWVSRFIKVFMEPGIGFAGGIAVNQIKDKFFSEVGQEITNHFVRFFGANNRSTSFLTSNNIAYRSHALQTAKGFDTCFRRPGGEERALNYRMLTSGVRGILISDLVIEHYHVMNLRSFFRQQRNYGRGSYIFKKIIGCKPNSPPYQVSMSALYSSLTKSWLNENLFTGMLKIIILIAAQTQILSGYYLELCTQSSKKRQE